MAGEKKPAKQKVDIGSSEKGKPEKMEALNAALTGIEKQFGKGSIMRLGDNKKNENIKVIPTGSLSLDVALGIGGVPRGRIVEVFGPESSGKTTVALHIVAEAQKNGGIAGYVDAEHALDPIYAKNLGVDVDELYISQPDDGEQALEIAEAMIRSGALDIVVVDSVAALVPRAEIEGEMGDSHMGLQARLMSQALRKLIGVANKTGCTVLFINQLREKIGVSYGNPETTTGGRALKFYASVRIDIRRTETLKSGTDMIGNRTRVKIAKNKLAPPFKQCEFDIMYGEGISREGDILDIATDLDIVNKSGSWFSYNNEKLGQGREKVKVLFSEKPWLCREVENKVREMLDLKTLPPIEEVIDSEDGETTDDSTKKTKAKKIVVTDDGVETDEDLEIDTDIDIDIDIDVDEELDITIL
ncbi:MAG: recombinase RecA [Lachnospirales bacterium]